MKMIVNLPSTRGVGGVFIEKLTNSKAGLRMLNENIYENENRF